MLQDGTYPPECNLIPDTSLSCKSVTFTVGNISSAFVVTFASFDASYELYVKAIKLELGTEQTLAHQENGQWVLNEIPDYGQELAKCQRYYETGIGYLGMWPIADFFDTTIPFKVTKATSPTFENLSVNYIDNGQFVSVPNSTAMILATAPLYGVRVYSSNNGLPANTTYVVNVAASADL